MCMISQDDDDDDGWVIDGAGDRIEISLSTFHGVARNHDPEMDFYGRASLLYGKICRSSESFFPVLSFLSSFPPL